MCIHVITFVGFNIYILYLCCISSLKHSLIIYNNCHENDKYKLIFRFIFVDNNGGEKLGKCKYFAFFNS